MYVVAAWTGFRKGEIGSLTKRSLRFDDDPATATVAACYSKRRREDTAILHPDVARRLAAWLETKGRLAPDYPLFPVSGRVPGGTERKTEKMMMRDLAKARDRWIKQAKTNKEKEARQKSDFLSYCNHAGLYANFHTGSSSSRRCPARARCRRWPRRSHGTVTFGSRLAFTRTWACMTSEWRMRRCPVRQVRLTRTARRVRLVRLGSDRRTRREPNRCRPHRHRADRYPVLMARADSSLRSQPSG